MAPDARRRLLMIGCIAFVFAIFIIPRSSPQERQDALVFETVEGRGPPEGGHGGHQLVLGVITGQLTNGTNYTTNGPTTVINSDVTKLRTTDNVR